VGIHEKCGHYIFLSERKEPVEDEYYFDNLYDEKCLYEMNDPRLLREITKQEGFESIEDMFEWLESYADLLTFRPFYLYGLEYVK